MKKNLFIFVTNNGVIYDRTAGRNIRIREYSTIELSSDKIVVFGDMEATIKDADGNEIIKRSLKPGMYIITPLFIQLMPKISKDVKTLYNKIKMIANRPSFKIDEVDNLSVPFKIILTITNSKGVLSSKFAIKVKTGELTPQIITDVFSIMEEASFINFRAVYRHFNIDNQHAITLSVNKDFFDMARVIENLQQKSIV